MGKLRNNQEGFSVIEAVLIVVIIAIVSFVSWFVWHSKQTADKTLTNTASATPVSKKPPSHATATLPNTAQGNTKAYLKIKELGIEIPLTSTTTDMSYTWDSRDNSAMLVSASLFKEAMQADPANCSAANAQVQPISFISTAATHAGANGVIKSVTVSGKTYNWFLPGAGSGCALSASPNSAFNTDLTAYYTAALSSFSLATQAN